MIIVRISIKSSFFLTNLRLTYYTNRFNKQIVINHNVIIFSVCNRNKGLTRINKFIVPDRATR